MSKEIASICLWQAFKNLHLRNTSIEKVDKQPKVFEHLEELHFLEKMAHDLLAFVNSKHLLISNFLRA